MKEDQAKFFKNKANAIITIPPLVSFCLRYRTSIIGYMYHQYKVKINF